MDQEQQQTQQQMDPVAIIHKAIGSAITLLSPETAVEESATITNAWGHILKVYDEHSRLMRAHQESQKAEVPPSKAEAKTEKPKAVTPPAKPKKHKRLRKGKK